MQLRAHRPGDIGWLISRHGELYAAEYGFDSSFESLVARIAADFIDRFDPAREACWIAERSVGSDGRVERLGCVVLVQARDDPTQQVLPGVAQLRLLIVEPSARGLGIGVRLVRQCTAFARAAGYRRLRLWTQSNLVAARAIYQREGYRLASCEPHRSFGQDLVSSEPHRSFGQDLVAEFWELELR